jgi:hypothetical protein
VKPFRLITCLFDSTMRFLHHAVIALLLGCLLPSSVSALEGVLLGQLEMEMGSRSNTNPNEFLVQVITQTQDFLNDAFSAIYEDTDYQFSHTSLSVTTYSIDDAASTGNAKKNGDLSYIASMDLAGTIFFGDAPPQEQVSTVISAAFQQQNQLFLQSLLQSTDPFLQDIDYAIVRVVKKSGNTNNQANATEASSDLDSWMLAIIVGAGTFIVVFFCCLLFVCFTPLSELQPDIEQQGSHSGKHTINPIDTKDTMDNASEDGAEFWEGEDPERPTPTSLSPARSMMSQDSSRFTYNPKSGRSNESDTGGGFLSGPSDSLEIEAWEQEGTINRSTNMPFGHDISAIEKNKDLSLIEEGDFEDVTPQKPETGVITLQQQKLKGQYLSRQAMFETDHRRGGRGTGTGASSQQRPSGSSRGSNNDNNNSNQGASSSSSASRPPKVSIKGNNNNTSAINNVIDDLNDLSAQFDKHRGGSGRN